MTAAGVKTTSELDITARNAACTTRLRMVISMARAHANVQIGIWDDPDFRGLTTSAQLLYLQLLSSSTLTYAGVADWRSNRIAMLSRDRTVDDVEDAMQQLAGGMFVVVDDASEEAFIRSFFKWDGLLQKPNVAKAMVREWGTVHSLDLRAVIVHELRKLKGQFPEWRAFQAGVVDELLENPSLDPAEMVQRRVPERVQRRVAGRDAPLPTTYYPLPATNNLQPTTDNHLPAIASREPDLDALFSDAYEAWPKKVERKKSLEKFKQACKRRDPHELVDDIHRFAAAYKVATTKQFVPALNVWLNGERWTDELPEPDSNQLSVDDRQRMRQQESLNVIDHFRQMEQHEQKELRA